MNKHAPTSEQEPTQLSKLDAHSPALFVTARDAVSIKGGTIFGAATVLDDTPVHPPQAGYITGSDYFVRVADGVVLATLAHGLPADDGILGGFHYAPGGNASARAGGDDVPAINPCSLWDVNFRPTCPDPRGMTLIAAPHGKFWCDIYLTGVDHLADGTSRFGVTIADGEDCPLNPSTGKTAERFDYATASAVMAQHGKALLRLEDFFAAAIGVAEKSAAGRDPKNTRLDAPRTSRFGLMQATGNLWIWGHDGDPDEPRASLFGGSWFGGDHAGSRYAAVGHWPDNSGGTLGARGRSGHLQPV